MSEQARCVSEAVERLGRRDFSLKFIELGYKQHNDVEVAELVDCLLVHPNVVSYVILNHSRLTDETGIKLARYVAASSTITALDLSKNQFGSGTYLALAAALWVNSSLRELCLFDNQAVDQSRIDAAFIEALRLNPDRSDKSHWGLYSFNFLDTDFKRLKDAAKLGHPSLQSLLMLTSDQRSNKKPASSSCIMC